MIDSELDTFRAALARLQAELESIATQSDESTGTVQLDQACVGRLSRMDALQAQQMALEADRRRRLQLAEIDRAFARVASGEYGDCDRCDEEIDRRRLLANPLTTRCITCAD
jgi:DnaK suppressor protein